MEWVTQRFAQRFISSSALVMGIFSHTHTKKTNCLFPCVTWSDLTSVHQRLSTQLLVVANEPHTAPVDVFILSSYRSQSPPSASPVNDFFCMKLKRIKLYICMIV